MQAKRSGPGAERGQTGGSRSPDAKFSPPPPPAAFGKPSVKSVGNDQAQSGGPSLHELFTQQTRAMFDRTDLNEEQKQNILIALSCPCCGAGGLSFTAKIKRRR
jgi:hypothetical protein